MCGRFTLMATWEEVVAYMSLLEVEPFPPRYNIAPTQPILLVMADEPREPGSNLPDRKAVLVRWGLIPAWAKDPKSLPLLINARSETAAERNTFKAAMRHRRALVPASGFFEWKKVGNRKQPFFLRPKGGGLVAFAGLMETYLDPNGSEIDTGAILTTNASPDIADIHDRMPVVVKPEDFSRWLDCRSNEPKDVADILQPPEQGMFEAIAISDLVNKVANTGPEILRPAALQDSPAKPTKPDTKPTEGAQLSLL
ncbi:SOS response-associated peptidase [Pseudaminobacter sp. 19-2017]|uniref:Abasic site processing protein n=1 Tax=Pseudaminobacter soli (ex Zhang et al. 2022) TaxID=2831468 RepID=A0A942I3P6_9HYPH|nr:SOS response-associated peptidase [Pseudaminobacter soli]MBS3650658.1 SOS response-associated peptidase [Pseudaminobacter soli]